MTQNSNPLLEPWQTPYQMPPFACISPAHFPPAFEAALKAHEDEIAAIRETPEPPSFPNTIDALERSGALLRRISAVFFNLASADANDALQDIERDIAPRLARHSSTFYTDGALFRRVDHLYGNRTALDLTGEQQRVLDRYHRIFIRAGARLNAAGKARMAAITQRMAELTTRFAQNVLADESHYRLVLEGEDDLVGLPSFLRDAAALAAEQHGLRGRHVITLARSSIEPFLQFSARRDLREQVFRAWIARGATGGATDNRAIIAEILALRSERARLLGFDSFAALRLEDTMAKSADAVRDLLMAVWGPARRRADQERAALQAIIGREGGSFDLAPWDWRFYSEKRRRAEHDLDEAELKPYFQLDQMIAAAFDTAHRLFGLRFGERFDLPIYHPDLRIWEVSAADGRRVGLFCGDYFTRPGKRSGAWMSAFRSQQRLDGEVLPIVVNILNFVKAGPGQPTLLSLDDARTLFHEFGHALHGLLSDVTYPIISGTNVDRDFVELPSQLFEHWLLTPEVLNRFAVHAATGAPMPADLLRRFLAARNFNQGFAMVEYVGSALIDLNLHQTPSSDAVDVDQFEAAALSDLEMPAEIVLRHRPPHFLHLFAGDGYAAGYYSYLWAEVMDADAFRAFEDAGDVFDPTTARRLHDFIYSSGGRLDPAEAYRSFRGRPPATDALLEKRGLTAMEPAGG